MDFNEFEQDETTINTEIRYSDDIEFVVEQLSNFANAMGRYSREVQLPVAIKIVERLKNRGVGK